jgi:hypothetical protein
MATETSTINIKGQQVPQDTETSLLVENIVKFWTHSRHRRYNFEVQWQESALLLLPEWANTFWYGYDQWPGQKKTQQQVDSTGMLAVERFGAIVDSLLTPFNDPWSRLRVQDPSLRRKRRVKEYFNKLNTLLWDARYAEYSNFQGQNQQNYQGLGVFGNMALYVDELDGRYTQGTQGLRYRSISPGELYIIQNHQGLIDGYFMAFRRTARQIWQRWPDTFPATLKPPLEQGSNQLYWVLQYVCPRSDGSTLPWRVDAKGMPWASYYISVEGHVLLEEGGYHSFPMAIGRYSQAPDEEYGRGPAQKVLPSLKTLNAEKVIFLKQGHRAADPIYLTADDNINFKMHPGAWNGGAMSRDGKRLVDILPTGNIQVTEEMMQEERALIKDEFLVSLFQMAWEDKDASQRSVAQVVQFIHDRGMLVAPTLGRQHSEYLGPLIHRELSILARLGRLPDLPPELQEARGQYKVEYTSPLMRALRSSKTAGFMRVVEMISQVSQATGEPEHFDHLAFKRALPDIAENEGLDEEWLATAEEFAAAQQQRQQMAEREARAKELPAEAAIMKAQAISDKAGAGMNTGGTLSGTAPGQNPVIPGNPKGVPGQPGIGGAPGLPGQPGR